MARLRDVMEKAAQTKTALVSILENYVMIFYEHIPRLFEMGGLIIRRYLNVNVIEIGWALRVKMAKLDASKSG